MKKIFLSIIVLLLTANIFAQEITSSPPKVEMLKHEVGLSIGMIPEILVWPVFTYSLNFEYMYNINNKHSIGCVLSGTTYFLGESGFLPVGYLQKKSEFFWWVAPQIKYKMIYHTSIYCSLYFSLSGGVQIPNLAFAYQFNPIGITIGSKHAANIELGYGTQGIVKIGYRYQFNSK
jgi:hypothetical protein